MMHTKLTSSSPCAHVSSSRTRAFTAHRNCQPSLNARTRSRESTQHTPKRDLTTARSAQQELWASLLGAAGQEAARTLSQVYDTTTSGLEKAQRLLQPPPAGESLPPSARFLLQAELPPWRACQQQRQQHASSSQQCHRAKCTQTTCQSTDTVGAEAEADDAYAHAACHWLIPARQIRIPDRRRSITDR